MNQLTRLRTGPPARLATILRPLWLLVVGCVAALVLVATPRLAAELQRVCAGRLCLAGQVPAGEPGRLAGLGLSLESYGLLSAGLLLISATAHLGVAAVIFWRRPADLVAALGALALLLLGLRGTGYSVIIGELGPAWSWVALLADLLAFVFATLFFCLFPSGRLAPRWAIWLAPLSLGALVSLALLGRLGPPLPIGRLSTLSLDAWFVVMAAAQLQRYRTVSTLSERQQTKWVVYGVALGYGGGVLADLARQLLIRPPLAALGIPSVLIWNLLFALQLLVPLAFGMAILRARLYAIDGLVGRTLLYGALTTLLVAAYLAAAGLVGALLRVDASLPAALIAAGCVAALFAPLHRRLQLAINRMLYGQRDEPYAVVARLSRQLAGALEPAAVLPTIVQTLRQALRLPYVAVLVDQGGRCVAAASSGAPAPGALRLPLRFQGEALGELLLGPRAGDEGWSVADRRLLAELAEHAGTAVHAVRLTLELQQARARVVSAREEERRRLRRDIHDGLGPTLASLTMQIETARSLLHEDPDAGAELLAEVQGQLRQTLGNVRQIVYGLRPPALDQFGLALAVSEAVAHQGGPHGPTVVVETAEALPPLPAAVEVAAYYIAIEAAANVRHHARARRCSIRIWADDCLRLEVCDDGAGLPRPFQAGVGIQSMRERAAELGGGCTVEPAAAGGTRVAAWLPLGL